MKCPRCGIELKEKTNHCPRCDYDLSDIPVYEFMRVDTSSPEDRKSIIKVALITALLLAFVGYSIVSLKLSQLNHEDTDIVEVDDSQYSEDVSEVVSEEESTEEEESLDDYPSNYDTVNVTASSFLTTKKGKVYPAENLIDGDKKTAWSEGVDDVGLNQTITFIFDEKINLESMTILNGYCKTRKTYRNNPRIKQLKVSFDDGKSEVFDLEDNYNEEQILTFNEHHGASRVTLEILDVYSGRKYKDTSISEIIFNDHEN